MAGLGIRAYFNHTPEVPEHERSASLLSGKARFHRYLDTLARNLRQNQSILGDVPELLAIPTAIQGESNDRTETESVTSESARPQMSDPPPNGNAAHGEGASPPDGTVDSRGKEPKAYYRFTGRRITIGIVNSSGTSLRIDLFWRRLRARVSKYRWNCALPLKSDADFSCSGTSGVWLK